MVAWNIASHHPELVTKLIILNCPHPAIFLEHMKDPRSWYMFFMTLPVIPEKSILKGDGVDVFKGCDFDKFGEQGIMGKPIFARYTQLWTTYPTGMLNWYRQIVPELIWGSPKRLAKVTVPTLVLWGRDDKFAHESVAKRSVDQYTTQGRVEYLDNVNHWVTHMVPDVVNNRIEAFVNEK
jgi:pimeloyl-ACP methyl ester carboxylesterase